MQGCVCQLLLVNALAYGLEMCMAAGTICIPPLLLQVGMEESYMTMVLGVGPVMALILVPMIGSASDSWRGRFGRRRPFIWLLSVGFLLGLQIMLQASRLAALFSPQKPHWLKALLQAGAVCMLEFCGQACFTPLVALLSDLFPGEEESRRAFSVYSLMISLGGCIGYLLPVVDWSHSSMAVYLGGQEAFIYTLLSLIFLICLLSTAFISEEKWTGGGGKTTSRTAGLSPTLKPSPWRNRCCAPSPTPQFPCLCLALGRWLLMCVVALPRAYGVCARIPAVMQRLFVAELCSWMALMSFMLFYADFMGEGLYKGVAHAPQGSQDILLYDEGVRVASLGLFLQCVTSAICSLLIERWVVLLGARAVYFSSVVLLALATAVMSLSESVLIVTAMAAATGYTFCVLQILPYMLLCLYHSDRHVYFSSSKLKLAYPQGSDYPSYSKPLLSPDLASLHGNSHPGGVTLPGASGSLTPLSCQVPLQLERERGEGDPANMSQRGMCLDVAILDSAYLLSQVLSALCLGTVVHQAGSVRAYMVSACSLSLLALLCSTRVTFQLSDLQC
ncbi:solute carrier family 45 member 3 isoform X2 [Hypomesus transpacificus]|uniref:solute carrier family 45 member 3 isoform X2 n=1 Tax=Hypomesus transpacificus TaxID=137520 RepID=UPI001F077797|nr:solute carrier family 45 member 3 isoform X2 [Hypomesus transpacificus]